MSYTLDTLEVIPLWRIEGGSGWFLLLEFETARADAEDWSRLDALLSYLGAKNRARIQRSLTACGFALLFFDVENHFETFRNMAASLALPLIVREVRGTRTETLSPRRARRPRRPTQAAPPAGLARKLDFRPREGSKDE